MSNPTQVGIWSVGVHLPDQVVKNDYWPKATVDRWTEKMAASVVRAQGRDETQLEPGARAAVAGMAAYVNDPFKGVKERRIMPEGMRSSDLEVAAGRDALQRAGVEARDIDVLLVFSQLPDFITIPNCALVHQKLGLRADCFTLTTEAACNSFLQQYTIAEQMILSGRAKRALLIQSSGIFHATPKDEQHSAWFGDAATAVVIGEVKNDFGTLGTAHFTDGSYHRALVTGSATAPWWKAEHPALYIGDPVAARRMLMSTADLARGSVHAALDKAGLKTTDVDFYATHQGAAWMRKVTQEYAGLSNARTVDTFAYTASLSASNAPFMLASGEREGVLKPGDVVACHSGGGGIMWAGLVLRWGRG